MIGPETLEVTRESWIAIIGLAGLFAGMLFSAIIIWAYKKDEEITERNRQNGLDLAYIRGQQSKK